MFQRTVLISIAVTVAALPAPQSGGLDSLVSGIANSGNLGNIGGLLSGLGGQAGIVGDFAKLLGNGDVKYGPAPEGCSPYEILVARGTGEPGDFGAIVGDPLVLKVSQLLNGTRGYSVHYPASLGMGSSPNIGADDVINRLNKQSRACPNQTFALVGYSQGAGVMHLALSNPTKPYQGVSQRPVLDSDVPSKIKAIVLFGDPGLKTGFGNDFMEAPAFSPANLAKLRENCNKGDPVCDPTGSGFEKHVLYGLQQFQDDSAAFIVAGFRNQPLPSAPRTIDDLGLRPADGKGTSVYAGIIGPIAGSLLGGAPAKTPSSRVVHPQ